jgi:hypothetical protein
LTLWRVERKVIFYELRFTPSVFDINKECE